MDQEALTAETAFSGLRALNVHGVIFCIQQAKHAAFRRLGRFDNPFFADCLHAHKQVHHTIMLLSRDFGGR